MTDELTINKFDENEMDISLDENENQEDEENNAELRDFDLELLIVEGKDAIIDREVAFFNTETKKQEKMIQPLKPVQHTEWVKAEAILQKKSKQSVKDFKGAIVSKGWVKPDGTPIPLSVIRKLAEGTVDNIYEEIKIISGKFEDRTEDKLLDKLAGF